MREIELSYTVEPPAEQLRERLTPRSILEYADVYEVRACEPTDDGAEATVAIDGSEMTVQFSALEDGYEYRFVDGEMFAERYSRLTVEDGEETRVTATARYTFDSIWSFVLDRLGAKTVRRELELTITNLLEDVKRAEANDPPREE
ncbi:hypothetical protein [Natronococcus occultus]|uniref:Polyketide cyclase / dehydrase and lipid transport n=1 Tax=Natronococcus occultus SP4 TaxID=694430 RepID=L0K281_9EURY|nr:hypothetical protein [Natronococcus occultus]AGB38459.1 hypothetical protein Natoc_2698 [Natronococcus occultus SP4]